MCEQKVTVKSDWKKIAGRPTGHSCLSVQFFSIQEGKKFVICSCPFTVFMTHFYSLLWHQIRTRTRIWSFVPHDLTISNIITSNKTHEHSEYWYHFPKYHLSFSYACFIILYIIVSNIFHPRSVNCYFQEVFVYANLSRFLVGLIW